MSYTLLAKTLPVLGGYECLIKVLCASITSATDIGCTQVIFYCHYPDYLLASKQGWLHQAYRAPLNWLEQTTTGQAHRILVNSSFTKGVQPPSSRARPVSGSGHQGSLVPVAPVTAWHPLWAHATTQPPSPLRGLLFSLWQAARQQHLWTEAVTPGQNPGAASVSMHQRP